MRRTCFRKGTSVDLLPLLDEVSGTTFPTASIFRCCCCCVLAVVGGGGRGGRGDDGFGVEVTMVEGEGTKLVAGCGREEPTPPCDVVFGGWSAMPES